MIPPSFGNFRFSIIAFTLNESGNFTVNYSVTHKESEFYYSGIVTQSSSFRYTPDEFIEDLKSLIMSDFRSVWLRTQVAENLKNLSFTATLDFLK